MKENNLRIVIPVDFESQSRIRSPVQPLRDVSQVTGTQQVRPQHPRVREVAQRTSFPELRPIERIVLAVKLHLLPNKRLNPPLDIIVERDDGGFIARTPDLPLYGFGEDSSEAIEMLKREIESLYEDLMEDDDFSEKWLRIKKFLVEIITD